MALFQAFQELPVEQLAQPPCQKYVVLSGDEGGTHRKEKGEINNSSFKASRHGITTSRGLYRAVALAFLRC